MALCTHCFKCVPETWRRIGFTDVLVHNMVGQQRRDGSWHGVGIARPPMEDGDFSRTALAIRALNSYPIPARKTEFDRRIQRAAAWLKSVTPQSTEDRSMQLLGMKWSGMEAGLLQDPLEKLIALERLDGGWAQTPDLESDAYATGMALYTMHELGVPAGAGAYHRGVAYLVQTQLPDGSWHVVSRSPKFQPYFQWLSARSRSVDIVSRDGLGRHRTHLCDWRRPAWASTQ